jgi:DNA mismatch repair protein MutS2
LNDCQAHALRVLEFDKIQERASGYARSEEGRERLLGTYPLFERAPFERLSGMTADLARILASGLGFPFEPLPPLEAALTKLPKEGYSLSIEELYSVGLWCQASKRQSEFLTKQAKDAHLLKFIADYPDVGAAAATVFGVLTPEGELRDLPTLRDIRRRIAKIREESAAIMGAYLRDEQTRAILQSEVPTQRDGRLVLAVKANYKSRVRGLVHEVSATGQTVYLEPEDLLLKNNELLQEEAKLEEEIRRILREATDRLRPSAQDLTRAFSLTVELDTLMARAECSHRNAWNYVFSYEPRLALTQARHPLLGARAVPIDLAMDQVTRLLIVSGPNTGGKTVTLKTVGLLAAMRQFGLGLPCRADSSLPFFDGIFADIGDEQSLSQSLSTFSGHMKNVSGIVRYADKDSLVLLDELGSGTDPEEGSAIAMALLDRFIERGSLVLVTSHHGLLKNFGYSKPGCQNASVEFDGQTLSPTYRILIGIPGESHALDIAQRNGLPVDIVSGARSYLAEERADVSALIEGLKSKNEEAIEREAEQRRRLKEVIEEQRKTSLKELKLRQRELELKNEGVGELRRLLTDSRKELENLVRAIKEGELTKEKTVGVKEFLAKLSEQVDAQEETLAREEAELEAEAAGDEADEAASASANLPAIEPGCSVKINSLRRRGTVLRKAKKGYWLVETDNLKLTLSEEDLVPVRRADMGKPKVEINLLPSSESTRAVFDLDVRGMRFEEAMQAVRNQIESAALSNLQRFSIIHGLGEGVLKDGIRDFLSHSKFVASFEYARPEEGGFGRTFVTLR